MRIGLISCTKSKTTYPAPARELYQPSALFRGALAYLEPRADVVYVLSAKYGLLALDQDAAPYDQTLKDESLEYRSNWARQVFADLQQRHGPSLQGVTFEFHAGEAYCAELRPLLKAAGATCTSPVEGMTMGRRKQFYAATAADQPHVPRTVVRRMVNSSRATPNSLKQQGWYLFPVEPAEIELGQARRELVIPKGHPVRGLDKHGVYIYFDGDRCLYVGKASDKTLVGRALDYLFEEGGRADVYRVIREKATCLLIRAAADDAAARRLELTQIVGLEPVLNEGFIYATHEEKHRYRLGEVAQRMEPDQITGLKIHAEVWLAAALLHDAGHATFTSARLAEEIERRFGDTRRGIPVHIGAHCVANGPRHLAVEYSYLFRTDRGEYRLYRPGDSLHPSRSGSRTAPDQTDIPAVYWDVWRRWR